MKKCNIVDIASDLASEVWAEELPDDFEPVINGAIDKIESCFPPDYDDEIEEDEPVD